MQLHTDLGSLKAVGEAVGLCAQSVHERLRKAGYEPNANPLPERDKRIIKAYYEQTRPDDFSLADLAAALGRTKQFISRHARAMGLTNYSRPVSAKGRDSIKAATAGQWSRRPHPRGMLGKTHSDELKAAVSIRFKTKWATDKAFGIGFMSEEARNLRSDQSAARAAVTPASATYSRTKLGRREDLGGLFVRSSWEANYARYLNLLQKMKIVEEWSYEPETFWFEAIRRGVRSYKPDFRVKYANDPILVYVEVKGWMDDKSKTKLARMKKYHPQIKIELVGAKEYRTLSAKWKSAIPNWE